MQHDVEEANRLDDDWFFDHEFYKPELEENPQAIVATFPEARDTVQRLIKEYEDFLEEYAESETTTREYLSMKVPMHRIDIATQLVMTVKYKDAKEKTEERLRSLKKLWSFYNPPKKRKGDITDAQIAMAKEYPIKDLVTVGRANNARCVWHTPDKRPSMHVYPDNHCWCFSCGKGSDSIGVYMAIHNCDFITAVRALI